MPPDVVVDLPPAGDRLVAARLGPVMDAEGKLALALVALGLPERGAVAVVDAPGTDWVTRLLGAAARPVMADPSPLRLPVPDGALEAIVSLWSGFRGVDPADLAEADRALRPGGRLLVVHDYGRDDVSGLRDPAAPELVTWSRREGPFLRDAGFKIRVVHCFWTFASLEDARVRIATLGTRGEALAAALRRPRLSWNVAVYHRSSGATKP
jgi:SAM-dependent methyltransferase